MSNPTAREIHLENVASQAKRVVWEAIKIAGYPVPISHPVWRQLELLADKVKELETGEK